MRRITTVVLALVVLVAIHSARVRAAGSGHYTLVENWVHFPPEVTKWGMATGVDVDAHDNVYVLHRNEAMPIMVFDRHGNFLRAWGRGRCCSANACARRASRSAAPSSTCAGTASRPGRRG